MARLASVRVAGYYPAGVVSVRAFADLLVFPSAKDDAHVIDPCAGEGEALQILRAEKGEAPKYSRGGNGRAYVVELEATRAAKVRATASWSDRVEHGDFFHLHAVPQTHWHKDEARGGGSLLWLNPPYDADPEYKRLEERWLQRAATLLTPRGILAFVVPHYALAASATTLTTQFEDLACWRFVPSEWEAFKQVVVVGRKRATPLDPDFVPQECVANVLRWAQDAESIPTLDDARVQGVSYTLPAAQGFKTWQVLPLDLTGFATTYEPWVSDKGPVRGYAPSDNPIDDLRRVYPVASKLRATHLAAALAAGVYNGVRVEPDDPSTGLPPILVKGVFDKAHRTVEEKTNKDGEVTAQVQVQQPQLTVTLLDLTTGQFHAVASTGDTAETPRVDALSVRDLLENYGHALMRTMQETCPVLYDPETDANPVPMPASPRTLFPAQADAVRTILRLRELRPDRGVVLLGEIGVGKTTVALTAARAEGARRLLVLVPPHLLKSWRDQVAAVIPDARVVVLDSIPDVDAFANATDPGMVVALLSREKAKLGHGWAAIDGKRCGDCGAEVCHDVDYGKRRERCSETQYTPANAWARWLDQYAHVLVRYVPKTGAQRVVTRRRILLREELRRSSTPAQEPFRDVAIQQALAEALRIYTASADSVSASDVSGRALLALCEPRFAFSLAQSFAFVGEGTDEATNQARGKILMVLEPGAPRLRLASTLFAKIPSESYLADYKYTYAKWQREHAAYYAGQPKRDYDHAARAWKTTGVIDGVFHAEGIAAESAEALAKFVDHAVSLSRWRRKKCRAPLFQAVRPYRYPLAKYLCAQHPRCFDYLIADEVHEYASRNSAQGDAAQRLFAQRRPTLVLTGSLINGYAESAFMLMYGICPDFRDQYGRGGLVPFVDTYGYWKQLVQDKDADGAVVAFGTQSARVIRSVRKVGPAPGVMPLFQLQQLLPMAVTLQKEDLRMGIPPHAEERVEVPATDGLMRAYKSGLDQLTNEIERSRYVEGRAGKLWGALMRLPSYLDLAAVGNTDEGTFEIRWPESVPEVGGQVVVDLPVLDPGVILPKEAYVLNRIQQEIQRGRNVMVMPWHTRLIERYVDLIRAAGVRVVYLDATKVPTKTREAWIDKNVVKAKAQVLVCNPVVIQTGLNNLVWFSTQIWPENPGCNAIVYRQAGGRIDRIGQTEPSHLVMPIYVDTAQEQQHQLLMHKVGVSKGVDGLDPEEALRAAGILEQDQFSGLSVGKALYRMLEGR